MKATDLLKQQHDEVRALFEEFEQSDDGAEKQALFQEIADNLAAHATIEEKIFYPAAYATKTKELLTEAVEEHLALKRIIADLLDMPIDHENFEAKITVLKEQVEHHIDEEENDLFKAARKVLTADKLEQLGAEMQDLFEEEMSGEPSDAIPEQIDEAAPLR